MGNGNGKEGNNWCGLMREKGSSRFLLVGDMSILLCGELLLFFFSFHFPFLHLNDAGEDHVISKPKQRSSDSGALLLYLTYKKVVMSQFFF